MWNGRRGINRHQGLKLRDIREESDQCLLGIVRDKGPTKKGWFCIGTISRFSAGFFPCRPSAARTSSPTDPVQRKLLSLATQCSEAFSQCRPIAAFSPYWPSAKHSLLPLPRQHSLPINATAKRDPGAGLRKIESKTTLRTRTQNILSHTHTGKRHEGVKFG